MSIYVDPKPGMVVRYGYLWARQARMGQDNGEKFRPSLILAVRNEEDKKVVYVAPITHTAPFYPEESILIPMVTKARLGLDSEKSWIMANEVNKFEWPGVDISRVPDRVQHSQFYGFVPGELLQQARDKMKEMNLQHRFNTVARDVQPVQVANNMQQLAPVVLPRPQTLRHG